MIHSPDRQTFTYDRRGVLRLFGLGAKVGGAYAIINALCPRLLAAAEEKKPLDFENYRPPKEGVIIVRKFLDKGRKTVIWMPDKHFSKDTEIYDSALIHLEHLRVLQAFLDNGIKVPQVVESAKIGDNFEDLVKRQRRLENPSQYMRDLLAMMDIPDLEQRRQFATQHILGKSQLLTPLLAKALYPEELEFIGTDTPEEFQHSLDLRVAYDKIIERLRKVDDSLCLKSGSEDTRTMTHAVRHLSDDKMSRDCYCGFRRDLREAKRAYKEERWINAPKREVQAAIAYQGSNFVFIHAGLDHFHTTVAELDRAQVNYYVISPRSFEEFVRQRLRPSLSLGEGKLPSVSQECDRWETAEEHGKVEWIP